MVIKSQADRLVPMQILNLSTPSHPSIRPNLGWAKGMVLAFSLALWSSPALALPQPFQLQNKNAPYTPPPDAGTPVTNGGTGSRGGCVDNPDRPPLAALVGQPHLMLTTSDRPVFWIYVPYTPEEAPSGFISLQQGDYAIYEGNFSLAVTPEAVTSEAVTPGVVGIQLPESAPSLVAGQEYDWFIDIHCVAAIDDGSVSDNTPHSLNGLVQRVGGTEAEALASDLSQANTGLEVVATYGRHHIWFDWLTELARLRLAAESNAEGISPEVDNAELETTWTTVLSDEKNVLLETWATVPLGGEIVSSPIEKR